MADIFLSYSRQDREIASWFAGELSQRGYDVWWDTELVATDVYHSAIHQQLNEAKAAIVIWSPNSVRSDWVLAESDYARKRRRLICTAVPNLDSETIPIIFQVLQIELINDFDRIVKALERLDVAPSLAEGPSAADQAAMAEFSAELELWNYVKDRQDPRLVRQFLSRFPDGQCAFAARDLLASLEWSRAAGSGYTAVLRRYIEEFGDTSHADAAKRKLEEVRQVRKVELQREFEAEDDRAWALVRERSALDGYQEYLDLYPKGQHAEEARRLVNVAEKAVLAEDAAWKEIEQGSPTSRQIRRFIRAYPTGLRVERARQLLGEVQGSSPRSWTERFGGARLVAGTAIGIGVLAIAASVATYLSGSIGTARPTPPQTLFTEKPALPQELRTRPPAEQVAGITAHVSSGAWEYTVRNILLTAFDTDRSGLIDIEAELQAIHRDVFKAIDEALRKGGRQGLRIAYGFDPPDTYRGNELGIAESKRASAIEKISLHCSLKK